VWAGANEGRMKFLGSNHKTAAAWNRELAIRLLRRHGTLSRHDIARMTKLQGSTLSYIVRELLEKNVVRVVGKRQSANVGQKQVLLTLNPDLGWLLGVSVRPAVATMVLLDAAGGRIDGTKVPVHGPLESIPALLHEALARWLARREMLAGRMLGVGIGVPGVVDADAGVVLRSIPFRAVNVPLQRQAADLFGVTTVVDHDACHAAFAEATDGAAADVTDFVLLSVNATGPAGQPRLDAYGSALHLQGKIYRGAFYGAGELSGALAPADTDLTEADVAILADPDGAMPPTLQELADRFGASLAPIVNLVDVQMVVLAGTVRINNSRFIAAVQAAVTDRLVSIPGRAVRVVRSAWEPEGAARGGAIAAFDAVLAQGHLFGDTDERKVIRTAKDQALPV
jgi:predicted NBD/HSP70 family sugar kinase